MGLSNEAKESLLQAMDIIANKATSEIAFDSTIKCIIVNNDKAEDGYYTVANGNTKFTAYSEVTTYQVNENVRVSIPNNDFTSKKYIIGKCANEEGQQPVTYVSAKNSILEVIEFVDNENLNIGIEANSSTPKKNIPLPDIGHFFEDASDNEIFNTLYLEIGFQTRLNSVKIANGNYGVRLLIYNKNQELIGSLRLDSSEFFGNPYAFSTTVKQSKKIALSNIDKIGSLILELYQERNFGYYVNAQTRNVLPTVGQNNIFVKSVKIGFGTDLSQVEDNTVKIFCKNGLTYETLGDTRQKEISLLWYNKTEDNTYLGFSDGIAYKQSDSDIATITGTDYRYLYDENDYLIESETDSKIKSQLIDEVPTDLASLTFRADSLEAATKTKEVYELVSKDLIKLLDNFRSRVGQECLEITSLIDNVKNNINGIVMKNSSTTGEENKTIISNVIPIIKNNQYSIFGQPVSLDIYKTKSYSKGDIISSEEYDSISRIESTDSSNNNNKKWFSKAELDLNLYFSAETDGIEYTVKKSVRVKIKKNLKVNPIEQQAINILAYGAECQKYDGGAQAENYVKPLYSALISEYQSNYGFITYNQVKDYLDKVISLLTTFKNDMETKVNNDFNSFKGIWTGQKEKINSLITQIRSYYLQANPSGEGFINNYTVLKLPRSITIHDATYVDRSIYVSIVTYNNEIITYSSTSNWTYSPWESTFDSSAKDNLYSIYWYRYEPDWQNKEKYSTDSEHNNKIIFKDWKMINNSLNVGLPSRNNTGKSIQYWNKNSTGENLPKLTVNLDGEKSQEKFKVLIVYNHNRYESDELVFTNVNKEVNLNISDEEKFGFQIINGENAKDNYQEHYNFTNQLISSSDSQVKRTLLASFKNPSKNTQDIFKNSWIYWYVPDGATMINYNFDNLINKGFFTDKRKTVRCNNNLGSAIYTYQMQMDASSLSAGDKVVIESEKKIGDTDYACIDTENSIYILKSSIELDTDHKLFYCKPNAYYYKEDSIEMKFTKNAKILVSTAESLYPNSNPEFSNTAYFTLSEDEQYYIALNDVTGTCNGMIKTSSGLTENIWFISDERIEKTILIEETNGVKKYKKVYFYDSEKTNDDEEKLYLAVEDFERGNNSLLKGVVTELSENVCTKYTYGIYPTEDDKGNSVKVEKDNLKVIESEFKDSLTNINYYKIYNTTDQFILKSDFDDIQQPYSRDGYFCFYKKISNENDKKFEYYIKNTFSQDAVNNTIMCALEGESWTIEDTLTTKTLSFGTYGANGTEYSIQVVPSRKLETNPNTNLENLHTTLNINLYNGQGEQESFSEPVLSWIGPTSCLIDSIQKDYDGKGYLVTVIDRIGEPTGKKNESKEDILYTVEDYYAVLKIEINLEKVTLESHYPIPYTSNENYYIDGATSIVYNSIGSAASYCLDPYKIYEAGDSSIDELSGSKTWTVEGIKQDIGSYGVRVAADSSDKRYLPTIASGSNILSPLSLFVSNDDCYASVVCTRTYKDSSNNDVTEISWVQPIVIMQNRFGSTTLNNWDGKFKTDSENGVILSTMLGAGKKNSDNSFSGVLMGDVATEGGFSLNEINTGIYGFHEGSASFGFNVDGTAFLGKNGKGRITFDGDHGIIRSALWNGTLGQDGIISNGTRGMAIDLENGHIDANDFRLSSEHIKLESNPTIGGNWIDVGNDDTYLRFSNEGKLDIRVTNFELTYHQGENLLINTTPLENSGELLFYDNAWTKKETIIPNDVANKSNVIKVDGTNTYEAYSKGATVSANLLKQILYIKLPGSTSGYEDFITDYNSTMSDENIYKYRILAVDSDGNLTNPNFSDYRSFHLVGGICSQYSSFLNGQKKIKFLSSSDIYSYSTEKVNKCIRQGIIFTSSYFYRRSFYSVPTLNQSIVNGENAVQVILKDTFDKYFEIDDSNIKFKYDTWIRKKAQNDLVNSESSKEVTSLLPTAYLTSSSKRKCIRVDESNYTLIQTLKTSLESGKNYTLSGKIYVMNATNNSDGTKRKITFQVGNRTEDIECNVTSGSWININKKFKNVNADLTTFKITDGTDHNKSGSTYYTLFYHLQLEEGLSATQWQQSSREKDYADQKEDNSTILIEETDRSLNNMLETNSLFELVTDGGKNQGIFDSDDGKLIINAECIGTGLLRSSIANGDFYYKKSDGSTGSTGIENYEDLVRECDTKNQELEITDIVLTQGTLFDLRSGIIAAKKFELNAWTGTADTGSGLYFNSNPVNLGAKKAWLLIGNDTTHLKFLTGGKLAIKVTDFELTFAQGENLLYNTAPLEKAFTDNPDGWELDYSGGTEGKIRVYKTDQTERKAIQITAKNYILNQTLKTPLTEGKNYTLSGKIWINNNVAGNTIIFKFSEDVSQTIDCARGAYWKNIDLKFKNIPEDFSTFTIQDNSDHNYGTKNDKYTLFYHLMLEEGLVATAWAQSTQEKEMSEYFAELYSIEAENRLNGLLDHNEIFDRLFKNGTIQGITTDSNRNLYINASVIGAGVLRSNTLTGTFSYKTSETGSNSNPVALSKYRNLSDTYKENLIVTGINLEKGTLFDLNNGFFASSNVNLNITTTAGDYSDKLEKLDENALFYEAKTALRMAVNLEDKDLTYDINGDGTVTSEDARLILRYAEGLEGQSYRLKLNDTGLTFSNETSGKELFKVNATGVSADQGISIRSKYSSSNYCFYKGYQYDDIDEWFCLSLAVGNEKFTEFYDKKKAQHGESSKKYKDSLKITKETYKKYYDIDGDGTITSADARLILRYNSNLETTTAFETSFDDSGLYFYVTKYGSNGKMSSREKILGVDMGGVYIGKVYDSEANNEDVSGNLAAHITKYHQYGAELPTSPSVGMIYFKYVN